MATTPKGIWTPDLPDNYNLVPDLGAMANSIDTAIGNYATYRGTAAQRVAFTTAPGGVLWQDTDGPRMLWKYSAGAWVPAVWRWAGTTTQMNAFSAPEGFSWYNTSNNREYIRFSGVWSYYTGPAEVHTFTAGQYTNGWARSSGSPLTLMRLGPLVTVFGAVVPPAASGSSDIIATSGNPWPPTQTVVSNLVRPTGTVEAANTRTIAFRSNGSIGGIDTTSVTGTDYYVNATYRTSA